MFCTEQMQKWHWRNEKGSLSMVPLCEIRVKSAHSGKRLVHGTEIVPADPEKTTFKQIT